VALIVYLVRGPTIDERFATIQQVAAGSDAAALANHEREIDRLIDEMDDDDQRLDALRDYQARIEIWRIERRIARELPSAKRNGGRTAIERILADALRTAEYDPQAAVSQLETIVALYGPSADADPDSPTGQAVAIARRNLKRLGPLVERQRADHRAVIEDSLARAKELEPRDPAAASRIYEALVRQYGNEPWAANLIEPARRSASGTK
jgi:hypothetical protein